jgi:hypothetical protein
MEIGMSRTIRAVSALGAMAALGGFAIAAPATASASTIAATASTSATAQAGVGYSNGSLGGQSVSLKENVTCAALPSEVSSYTVNAGVTIHFYGNSACANALPTVALPGTDPGFWLYAEAGNYYSTN